uniref:Uncharacterized protein n=1 Tax=Leersia perrieri TaxID=77586 RepID=A0A0D9VNG1_9ORYZ
MVPYTMPADAEAALGRAMTWAEHACNYCLYCHNVPILLIVYTLASLHLRHLLLPHKLQPRVRHTLADFLRCYLATTRVLLLAVGPLQLVSYPAVVRLAGIRTGFTMSSRRRWVTRRRPGFCWPGRRALPHDRFLALFPLNPTKYIPFYGGVEYHDYHHFVGGHSQSNFSSVFTFCDYIYGTDKGYRYHKASLAKAKEIAGNYVEKGEENGFDNRKQD